MLEISLLNNIENAQIFYEPFPHLVIDNALPDDVYQKLKADFIKYEKYIHKNNPNITQNTAYPLKWGEASFKEFPNLDIFCKYHIQNKFKEEIVELVKKINNNYLNFVDKIKPEYFDLEANIRISTPATKAGTRQLNAHLDNARELFAILLYLKDEKDGGGGDLIIHKLKPGVKKYLKGKSRIPDKYVEDEKVIQYKANRLIFFINGPLSIHSVSERNISPVCRNLINVTGEFNIKMPTYNPKIISADTVFDKKISQIKKKIGIRDEYYITNYMKAKKVDKDVAVL